MNGCAEHESELEPYLFDLFLFSNIDYVSSFIENFN